MTKPLLTENPTENGWPENGCPESTRNGSETPSRAAMPDVHQTVLRAMKIGSGDGPLSTQIPQTAPWNALPPEAFIAQPVDILQLLGRIAEPMERVEREIARLITSPIKLITDLASHTLGAGGKRLRPALTVLCAQLCQANSLSTHSSEETERRVTICAASVELMHTTSLIHDDVIDSATTRRGKPSANLLWGNETSVLVGDYLSSQVFVTLAQPLFADLMPVIGQATAQLCAGELLETQTRGLMTMPESQYLEIIALKTAALTECACRVGAMAVNADEKAVEAATLYGRNLGMAFQMVDDVFDITATQVRVGKPVGNDIREGDITLPMLRAMQTADAKTRDELNALVGKDPISDADVERALEILRTGDAIEYSMNLARTYAENAKAALAALPDADNETREVLNTVADYVLSREK